MNKIFLIGAILVAAIFLIINTSNTTMAYTCSSTSSTSNTKTQTGISGSSGGCSSSSSAAISFGQTVFQGSRASGPNVSVMGSTVDPAFGVSTIGPLSGSGSVSEEQATFLSQPGHVESSSSSSSGGAQSSCSSSSASTLGVTTSIASSQSQPGRCP